MGDGRTLKIISLLLLCGQAHHGPVYIVDGDTLDVGGTRFRLHGVDAPERSTQAGMEARMNLSLIVGLDRVVCVPTGRTSHKRLVARCSTKNVPDLGAEIIRRGYALDCRRYSGGEYRDLETPNARIRLRRSPYC